MSRLVAIHGSDPALLGCLASRFDDAVGRGGGPGEALGVGHVDDGRVLLRKRPAGGPAALGHDVRGEALVATVQRCPDGFREEDAAPHRLRNWLFAGTGRLVHPGERLRVVERLPEFLRRGLSGRSDAELAFLATLAELHATTRHLEALDLDAELVARALARTLGRLDERACATAVLSNGRVLVAARRGGPLRYALAEGLVPCRRCEVESDTGEEAARVAAHRRFRAVVVASGLDPGVLPSMEVPEAHALLVDRSLSLKIRAL
jgi:glutamine amidotransferase